MARRSLTVLRTREFSDAMRFAKTTLLTAGMALALVFAISDAVRAGGELIFEGTATSHLAKPEFAVASKGRVLMVASEDFPNFARKVFLKVMAEKGVRADVIVSPEIPSKKAAFFIDGKLAEMSIADAPYASLVGFSDIGGALSVIDNHIKKTKAAVTGPVTSP